MTTDELDPSLITYTVRAQAIVEALADYESAHPAGAPCFHDALRLMSEVLAP